MLHIYIYIMDRYRYTTAAAAIPGLALAPAAGKHR